MVDGIKNLGKLGMGFCRIVYKGERELDKAKVVIKEQRVSWKEGTREWRGGTNSNKDERDMCALFGDHIAIPRLVAYQSNRTSDVNVFEYHGKTLRAMVETNGRCIGRMAARIAHQLVQLLDY